MSPEDLRLSLHELTDTEYRAFHLKTCPNAHHVLGVRVPEQRKLARTIMKADYFTFLDEIQPHYYEEILITGIVIASAPMTLSERLDYIMWFLPYIDNWALCDTFCASFNPKEAEQKPLWEFLLPLLDSQEEYILRFVLVMFLDHFLSPEYLNGIFAIIDQLKTDYYYVNMAIAWLIAEAFTKFRDETLEYLGRDQLTTFTHNKALQKASESRRVSLEDKSLLASLKL